MNSMIVLIWIICKKEEKRSLIKAGKTIIGFDLCEVAPGDNGDEWDGNVGARILYKLACLCQAQAL